MAMKNLLVKGQDGKVYLQKEGLAMGVAFSPDVTNLYGFFHEQFQLPPINDQLAFYSKYIDDVFAIVYLDHLTGMKVSLKALMEHHIHYQGCTINWGDKTIEV